MQGHVSLSIGMVLKNTVQHCNCDGAVLIVTCDGLLQCDNFPPLLKWTWLPFWEIPAVPWWHLCCIKRIQSRNGHHTHASPTVNIALVTVIVVRQRSVTYECAALFCHRNSARHLLVQDRKRFAVHPLVCQWTFVQWEVTPRWRCELLWDVERWWRISWPGLMPTQHDTLIGSRLLPISGTSCPLCALNTLCGAQVALEYDFWIVWMAGPTSVLHCWMKNILEISWWTLGAPDEHLWGSQHVWIWCFVRCLTLFVVFIGQSLVVHLCNGVSFMCSWLSCIWGVFTFLNVKWNMALTWHDNCDDEKGLYFVSTLMCSIAEAGGAVSWKKARGATALHILL